MAKKEGSVSGKGNSEERVYKLLLSVDERITNIEERLGDLATKNDLEDMVTTSDLEKAKQELLGEIKAIGKAVDKDALTLVNLEKRVVRIEKVLALRE